MQNPFDNAFWQRVDVRYPAVIASLLLSALQVWLNPIPNVDAFTYLRTAEIFLDEGLSAAFSHYSWAVYPVLIGVLHSLTGLALFTAAHLLNAFFYALLSVAFINIVREFCASRRLAILAALVVLLYPQLNEYRYYLIRDIAFLAFSLLALLQLVRYAGGSRLFNALGFCLLSLVAALFRPEALLYLVLAPFSLLLASGKPLAGRARDLLSLQAITLSMVLATAVALWLLGSNPLETLMRGILVYQPFLEQALAVFQGGSPELGAALFHEHASSYSSQYLSLFLITGLSTILLVKLFTGFGWVTLLILAYGVRNGLCRLPARFAWPALSYILIAFGILLAFIFVTRFLSTRYTFMFCTVFALLIPVILERAWQRAEAGDTLRRFNIAAGFLLLYCFIDAHISFGASKSYQQAAVQWVESTRQEDVSLLTNSPFIAYHSGEIRDYDRLERLVNVEAVRAAGAGSRLVYIMEAGMLETMQDLERQGLVTLERYYPDADDPEMGIFLKR